MNKTKNDFWGPAQWTALHCFAMSYTRDKAAAFVTYVNTLTQLLPCPICSNHFKQHLRTIPLENYLTNRESVFFWTYLIHDAVNYSLGKVSPPYHVARQYYMYKVFGN